MMHTLLLRRVTVRTVVNNRGEAMASIQAPLASTVFFQGVIFIGLSRVSPCWSNNCTSTYSMPIQKLKLHILTYIKTEYTRSLITKIGREILSI